jgi:hypothetical protein
MLFTFFDGRAISEAFQAYGKWYKELKEKGISFFREKSIMPLDGTFIKWF